MIDEYSEQARSIFKDAQEYWSLNTPSRGNNEEVIESIAAALLKLGQERDDERKHNIWLESRLISKTKEGNELKAESIGHIQLIDAQAKDIETLKARLDVAKKESLELSHINDWQNSERVKYQDKLNYLSKIAVDVVMAAQDAMLQMPEAKLVSMGLSDFKALRLLGDSIGKLSTALLKISEKGDGK